MNRNIKIALGLSLGSLVAAAILLAGKQSKCACCKDNQRPDKKSNLKEEVDNI